MRTARLDDARPSRLARVEVEGLDGFPGARAALVVAHPGHELRVHGWLEQVHPRVFVLTDGSGRSGRSRLGSTLLMLEQAGASAGEICGRLTDRAIYAAILDGHLGLFRGLVDELAAALTDVDYVAGDASEGYNPAHDVCRLVIDAAVRKASRARRRAIANFAFPLVGPPDRGRGARPGRVVLALGEAALARKMAAARAYGELTGEIDAAVEEAGLDAFRVEAFEPGAGAVPPGEPPYYERYGERQVARGFYARVLRYSEHVLPIARALAADERA